MGAGTGGSAVWDLALDYPEKFAALVPMGGFFRFTALSAKQAAKVPMYVVWGDSDEWLSQRNQRLIMADLRVAGAKVKFKEFPDTGKKCWNTITRDVPEFLPWVFAQRK
jgi:dienelactone hydrolase